MITELELPLNESVATVLDSVGFAGFPPQKSPLNSPILDAVGREILKYGWCWTVMNTGCCEELVRHDLSGMTLTFSDLADEQKRIGDQFWLKMTLSCWSLVF